MAQVPLPVSGFSAWCCMLSYIDECCPEDSNHPPPAGLPAARFMPP